jgi:hypothetical protein
MDFGGGTLDRGNSELVPSCCLHSGMRCHRAAARSRTTIEDCRQRTAGASASEPLEHAAILPRVSPGRRPPGSADSVCRISSPPGCLRCGSCLHLKELYADGSSRRRQLVRRTYKFAARWSAACATATSMRSSRLDSASAATGALSSGSGRRCTSPTTWGRLHDRACRRPSRPPRRRRTRTSRGRRTVRPIRTAPEQASSRRCGARCASRARRTHVATSPALW